MGAGFHRVCCCGGGADCCSTLILVASGITPCVGCFAVPAFGGPCQAGFGGLYVDWLAGDPNGTFTLPLTQDDVNVCAWTVHFGLQLIECWTGSNCTGTKTENTLLFEWQVVYYKALNNWRAYLRQVASGAWVGFCMNAFSGTPCQNPGVGPGANLQTACDTTACGSRNYVAHGGQVTVHLG